MSPLFFLKKLTTFFSHRRLPILRCHPHPYVFSPKKTVTTFFAHHCLSLDWFHSGVTPEGCLYLSDFVCPLFFVNLPTIFFVRVSPPWRVSPGAVRPPPVTPLRRSNVRWSSIGLLESALIELFSLGVTDEVLRAYERISVQNRRFRFHIQIYRKWWATYLLTYYNVLIFVAAA